MSAAQKVIDDLWVCVDCALAIANGDIPDDDFRAAEIDAGFKRESPNVWVSGSGDDVEFSASDCDCCGTTLAGRRMPAGLIVMPREPEEKHDHVFAGEFLFTMAPSNWPPSDDEIVAAIRRRLEDLLSVGDLELLECVTTKDEGDCEWCRKAGNLREPTCQRCGLVLQDHHIEDTGLPPLFGHCYGNCLPVKSCSCKSGCSCATGFDNGCE